MRILRTTGATGPFGPTADIHHKSAGFPHATGRYGESRPDDARRDEPVGYADAIGPNRSDEDAADAIETRHGAVF